MCADISKDGNSINRTVYFNKCTDILSDKKLYEEYRTSPKENLYFKNGPWLKQAIEHAKQAEIKGELLDVGIEEKYHYADVLHRECFCSTCVSCYT